MSKKPKNKRMLEVAEATKPKGVVGLNSDYHDLWLAQYGKALVLESARVASHAMANDNELRPLSEVLAEHFGIKEG